MKFIHLLFGIGLWLLPVSGQSGAFTHSKGGQALSGEPRSIQRSKPEQGEKARFHSYPQLQHPAEGKVNHSYSPAAENPGQKVREVEKPGYKKIAKADSTKGFMKRFMLFLAITALAALVFYILYLLLVMTATAATASAFWSLAFFTLCVFILYILCVVNIFKSKR